MKFSQKVAATLLAVTSFSLVLSPIAIAQGEDTVDATVTFQNVSLSVADGVVAYGTLGASSTSGTVALSDTQTVTNTGNVNEDFTIRGTNSLGWTLAGTAGANAYVHRFCTATCGTPPTNYTALTTSPATLATNAAPAATPTFDLHITAPTSSTSFTQQEVDVVVQASAT